MTILYSSDTVFSDVARVEQLINYLAPVLKDSNSFYLVDIHDLTSIAVWPGQHVGLSQQRPQYFLKFFAFVFRCLGPNFLTDFISFLLHIFAMILFCLGMIAPPKKSLPRPVVRTVTGEGMSLNQGKPD